MTSRLRIRMGNLTKDQRESLMRKLAMSESTFYRKQNEPGNYTWDELIVLKAYLDKLDGVDYDMQAMRKPVQFIRRKKYAA